MNAENEDLLVDDFQSASEAEDGSDVDFHSPVSQGRTDASESPSPPLKVGNTLDCDDVQTVECPDGVSPEDEAKQAETDPIEILGTSGPASDACVPVPGDCADVAGCAEESLGPDPEV